MSQPHATIAFVPREQFSTTRRSLETLYARTKAPFELVCVDGGSPPEIQKYLLEASKRWNFSLIRTESFLSPNQARNIALEYVKTKYVVFVDNDVLVGERFLEPLVECAMETGAWVVAPLYFELEPECHRIHMFGGQCRIEPRPDGSNDYIEIHRHQHQAISDVIKHTRLLREETELVEFHTVLVDMDAFQQIGRLDEGLLSVAEHADLCLLVRQSGHSVYLEPRSQITYAPPKSLTGRDLEYFNLRWSEAWAQASIECLAKKWDMPLQAHGLKQAIRWSSGHRRFALKWPKIARRFLGRTIGKQVEKRVIAPIDTICNRLRYPIRKYATNPCLGRALTHSPTAISEAA
jgi:GT2 family glycosyltransferase